MVLDINEIQKILPHRPPMLLVDRIIDLVPVVMDKVDAFIAKQNEGK